MKPLRQFLHSGLLILTGIAIFYSCRKEEMKVDTTAVTLIMASNANAGGTIIDLGEGVEQHGHCWDTTAYPTISASRNQNGTASKTGSFTSKLTGLEPGKTYHVRAYLQTGRDVVYGKDITFTTPDGKVHLFTNQVTNITINSASSGGNISMVNGDSVLSRGVCLDTLETVNLMINAGVTTNGSGTGSFVSELTGLIPGRRYYVKAYAITSVDISYATALSFITMDGKVSLTTNEVTSIDMTNSTATSGGNITADGGLPITQRGVCWSTSQDPTVADSRTNDGTGTGSFTSILSGLSAGTYYVRAYAINSMGTSYGEQQRTFVLTNIVEVTNPATGRTWMDRNLGASRAATNSNDSLAYGDLYQWGRGNDGHQLRQSATTATLSSRDTPGHELFIISYYKPHDWREHQNHNLWQGLSGINNPCPVGYRLPTDGEWEAERNSWSSLNATGAFDSPLKLIVPDRRINGFFAHDGSAGYWSGIVDGEKTLALVLDGSKASISSEIRANGYSVRCIRSLGNGLPELSTSKNVAYTDSTATGGGYVISDGGYQVTARGVCWSTSPNPTTADSRTINGSGTGSFTSSLSGLSQNDSYYIRAYATNSVGTSYGEQRTFALFAITSPTTGRIWMKRDLEGFYQWGRGNDGHEYWMSGTTTALSSNDTPGHGLFIIPPSDTNPHDWRTPQNDNLWQGVNGINNPCPSGYRVPTKAEWEAEITSRSYGNGISIGSLGHYCRRYRGSGQPLDCGNYGHLWSSTVDGTQAWVLIHGRYSVGLLSSSRFVGQGVRCIKD